MTFMKRYFLAGLLLFILSATQAQTPVDSANVKHSPLKTLTDVQYRALISGTDIYNMYAVALLNHYPDPEKVLKFKKELQLSPIQVNKLTPIVKELRRKKLEMGLIIIKNETVMDSLFRTNIINDGALVFYANRYGLYQGELRNAILQACLVTRKMLSRQQINKFDALIKAD